MTVVEDRATPPPPRPDLEPEPKSNFERVLLVIFVARPVPRADRRRAAGLGLGPQLDRRRDHRSSSTSSPGSASPSASTATSPTAPSRPSGRCGSRWRSPAALAMEGACIDWVADHRRHHKFSDKEGDPHSPWRFGNDWKALTKGLLFAHIGWLFDVEQHQPGAVRPGPAERQGHRAASHSLFPWLVVASLAAARRDRRPGDLVVAGALTAFFWAQPGADRAAAPRHLVDQLDLPRRSATEPFEVARQVPQRLVAGDPVLRRVVAQPAPRRPDLRPARRAAGPARLAAPA